MSAQAIPKERRNISRALRNCYHLDGVASFETVDDHIRSYRPEQNWISGEILPTVSNAGHPGDFLECTKEFGDQTVGGSDTVRSDVIPDVFQIQDGIGAEDIRVQA